MRTFIHHQEDESSLALFLLHGSTQLSFDKFHPLVRLFSKYPLSVISVELPGHGKSPFERTVNVNELLDIFYSEMKEILQQWDNVALCGYSLGGSLAFKVLEFGLAVPEFIISFGVGFVLGEEETELIRMFFSNSFFESLGWKRTMERIHDDWNTLIESIAGWYYPNSPILPSIEKIKHSKVPVLCILGENDEPFPHSKNIPLARDVPNVSLQNIPGCSHFDYFSKCWQQTSNHITSFLQQQGFHQKQP